MLALAELCGLFLKLVLLDFNVVFPLAELVVALANLLVVLALELEEFLLGLQDFLLLDVFSFKFRFLDNRRRPALGTGAANRYINCQGDDCTGDGRQNVKQNHIYLV